MAHKQCIKGLRLNHNCDCINDDIIELEVIKNNIKNLEKLLNNFYVIENHHPYLVKELSNYLKLRLQIENE